MVPPIASRASWGARHRDGDKTLPNLATKVVIHHTVTRHLPATATVAQEQAEMRNLEQIGQNRFGSGISYHVVVFPSGRAYQGVSFNRRGAHTGGWNTPARGLAFAGNLDVNQPTAAALATAAAIVAHGRGRWWTAQARVKGHRYFSRTACPGRHLYAQLATIRGGNVQAAGQAASQPAAPVGTPAGTALRRGETSARVRTLQQALLRIFPSYNTAARVIARVGLGSKNRLVSNTFGPVTEAWVRELQHRSGLPVTGIVDARTARAIPGNTAAELGF